MRASQKHRSITKWIWLLSACLLPYLSWAQSIVQNGDFETPVLNPSELWRTYYGGQSFDGWTVIGHSVDIHSPRHNRAFSGQQCVDLQGHATSPPFPSPGGIYQDLNTVPGSRYTLRFALAGNVNCEPRVKEMRVLWNGAEVGRYAFDTTGYTNDNPGWIEITIPDLIATDTSTRLQFESTMTTPTTCGPMIDAVRVCLHHDGDVDGNGCTDDADLLAVLFAFGQTGMNLGRVDVNCDETVDDADLLQVLFNFGSGC